MPSVLPDPPRHLRLKRWIDATCHGGDARPERCHKRSRGDRRLAS